MTDQPMTPDPAGPPPTEEEMRAAYEAELAQLRIEEVLIQTVVSLLNLGARKAGLVPGSEDERDLDQVRMAIESSRALLPIAEPALGPNAAPLKDALAQLQVAYAQLAGGGGEAPGDSGAGEPPAAQQPDPAQPGAGPAESSGRLWVPGQ